VSDSWRIRGVCSAVLMARFRVVEVVFGREV